MSVQELITEIKRLSLDERLALLETLTHTVRDELRPPKRRVSSLSRVRGMLKPDGPLSTGAELKDGYFRYLLEKYA